jgi:erythromycin esterase-like protein
MVLFIFALPYTIYGQEYSKDLIREQDSLVFDSIFKTVKVVGIGEVTHGDFTSQSLRLSLIDLLINKYSFRSICIEEHNKYVKGLNSLVQADTLASRNKIEELQLAIPKWMWKTVEFTDLIIDLNLYNLNHQQKI